MLIDSRKQPPRLQWEPDMTDKITIERETLERAITALAYHQQQTRPIERTKIAIDALRAALAAQPAECGNTPYDEGPFTLAQPADAQPEPVALDNACMTEQAIDEYLSDYTMEGDSEFHMPSESELALIKDAIMGLLVDPNFLAVFAPLTEPELRAGIALQLLEIKRLREEMSKMAQYAAPPAPAAVPLTDNKILSIAHETDTLMIYKIGTDSAKRFARAIEAAHGIGDKT
jgi:hypothetical protein